MKPKPEYDISFTVVKLLMYGRRRATTPSSGRFIMYLFGIDADFRSVINYCSARSMKLNAEQQKSTIDKALGRNWLLHLTCRL
ncbi:hypothetical protein SD71_08305 [Cohnella kolymensis]|uniref:Uncharacterized protein n=1 Tax=Cohnella kolymensis TaxID=1590652 RepID=A0ABR5A5D0_9BACL|nr:hypothetical protein SD71_08305 [Cohnella kolymensis]